MRQRIENYDADAGCGDMLDDFHQAQFDEGPSQVREDPNEATTKACYDMLSSAQKPFHGHTDVSQLDAIGRLMALKCQLGISRDGFDDLLIIFGTICHATCMRHKNYFVHLRCLTSRYMLVRMDASCLGRTMQMQSTALNVNHLDIWRSTQVMVRRGNSRSP